MPLELGGTGYQPVLGGNLPPSSGNAADAPGSGGLQGELGLDRIAPAVGRARATLQTWFGTYRQGGVDALLPDARHDHPGRGAELHSAWSRFSFHRRHTTESVFHRA